jgi:death-on-curing protein
VALLRTGGLDGVRDLTLIESAIARPYSGYYRSIGRKAAALTQSLAKNHGFLDGNKRATLLTLFLFLDRSGYELVGPDNKLVGEEVSAEESEILTDSDAERMILDVVEDRLSYDDLVKWFRAHVRRRQ